MKTLFVSSTFKDMQYERDAIQQIVLPNLNAIAKRYGQTLSICDLRWGINTMDLDSVEGSKKVLDVCLDQIDRCGSPMIVLLGERYGYIPGSEIMRDIAAYKKLELSSLEISVTALEIEYGAMSERQKKNTLFYLRDMAGDVPADYLCEDAEHAEKLAKLKERIVKLAGKPIPTYNTRYADGKLYGMEEFADMLVADIASVLIPEWEEQAHKSAFELDRKTQWDFIEDRNAVCRGREKLLADVTAEVFGGSRLVALKGDTGSGKSVVFSKLAITLRDAGWDVLPFVGGLTTESNDATDIMRNTVVYLQTKLHGGNPDELAEQCIKQKFGELRNIAEVLITEYCSAGNKFIIMVDAVDQLYNDANRNSLAFIPDVNVGGFCFLATFNSEFKELDVGSIPVLPLDCDEKAEVICGTLARYGRELDNSVIADMLALKSSDNPLYLGFLIKRLLMMYKYDFDIINSRGGHMGAISDYQRELIAKCPKSTDELCALLLDEAGKSINKNLVSKALKYIACSRFGLREADLRALLADEWNMLDFAHFITYMGDCFIMRDDGRYDFSHKSIRQGLLKTFDVKAGHKKILDYLKTVVDDDIFRTEVVYHIMQADDKEFFRAYAIKLAGDENESTQAYNELMSYLISACEFAGEYGGEWFADVIRTTPVTEEMMPFAVAMYFMSFFMTNSIANPKVAHTLNVALKELADGFAENGIKNGEELQQGVRFMLGQTYVSIDSDGAGATVQFSDAYEKALADYRVTPTAGTAVQLLAAARSRIATLGGVENKYEEAENIFNVIKELYETSKAQYAVERTDATARNFFMCANSMAMFDILLFKFDSGAEYVKECNAVVLDNLELFNSFTTIKVVLDYNHSLGAIVASQCTQTSLDLDNESDDIDEYSEYVNSEVDRMLDAINSGEDTEQKLNELLDFFDVDGSNYYDDEDDEYDLDFDDDDEDDEYDSDFDDDDEEYEYDSDYEYDEEDKETLKEILAELVNIGKDIFTLSATLSKYAADKLDAVNFKLEYCSAIKDMAIIETHCGNYDKAKTLLNTALDELKKTEESTLNLTSRQLAHNIKAVMLNLDVMTGADCDTLLPIACDLARDAENLASSSAGAMVSVTAQFEANSVVINLLMSKCNEYIENDMEVDAGVKAELAYWFDKTEKIVASPFIDVNSKRVFAKLKEGLKEILGQY